jgi:hypothetical protein
MTIRVQEDDFDLTRIYAELREAPTGQHTPGAISRSSA